MEIDVKLANRFGFLILGLTNNFGYVVMLAAAFDLLKGSSHATGGQLPSQAGNSSTYCNVHSTSTILLADIIPAFVIKLSYPFLLLNISATYKVLVVASLSAMAFLVTGFAKVVAVTFIGVACASFASGLGESTFLSNVPLYGDASLSGWSIGTGLAGLVGAAAYAVLRVVLRVEYIMILMLIVPVLMLTSYFKVIRPLDYETRGRTTATGSSTPTTDTDDETSPLNQEIISQQGYGTTRTSESSTSPTDEFTYRDKLRLLPQLAKYFLPLFLVYFTEYFINQGLFELIYYPEVTYFDHASQYSWFQVSYQVGVLISRSSLDLFKIKKLWLMSTLQMLNAMIFLAHAARLIHIPNFYLAVALIIYEGLLGGFTYTNTFHRVKSEMPADRREFSMGVVTVADTLGIVLAGLVALPVHDALCKLY